MVYTWKITRQEKILENGILVGAVVGVTCTNTETGNTGYKDWRVEKEDFPSPLTKASKIAYIKDYLQNTEDATGIKLIDQLKEKADKVITTFENDSTISEEDTTITI